MSGFAPTRYPTPYSARTANTNIAPYPSVPLAEPQASAGAGQPGNPAADPLNAFISANLNDFRKNLDQWVDAAQPNQHETPNTHLMKQFEARISAGGQIQQFLRYPQLQQLNLANLGLTSLPQGFAVVFATARQRLNAQQDHAAGTSIASPTNPQVRIQLQGNAFDETTQSNINKWAGMTLFAGVGVEHGPVLAGQQPAPQQPAVQMPTTHQAAAQPGSNTSYTHDLSHVLGFHEQHISPNLSPVAGAGAALNAALSHYILECNGHATTTARNLIANLNKLPDTEESRKMLGRISLDVEASTGNIVNLETKIQHLQEGLKLLHNQLLDMRRNPMLLQLATYKDQALALTQQLQQHFSDCATVLDAVSGAVSTRHTVLEHQAKLLNLYMHANAHDATLASVFSATKDACASSVQLYTRLVGHQNVLQAHLDAHNNPSSPALQTNAAQTLRASMHALIQSIQPLSQPIRLTNALLNMVRLGQNPALSNHQPSTSLNTLNNYLSLPQSWINNMQALQTQVAQHISAYNQALQAQPGGVEPTGVANPTLPALPPAPMPVGWHTLQQFKTPSIANAVARLNAEVEQLTQSVTEPLAQHQAAVAQRKAERDAHVARITTQAQAAGLSPMLWAVQHGTPADIECCVRHMGGSLNQGETQAMYGRNVLLHAAKAHQPENLQKVLALMQATFNETTKQALNAAVSMGVNEALAYATQRGLSIPLVYCMHMLASKARAASGSTLNASDLSEAGTVRPAIMATVLECLANDGFKKLQADTQREQITQRYTDLLKTRGLVDHEVNGTRGLWLVEDNQIKGVSQDRITKQIDQILKVLNNQDLSNKTASKDNREKKPAAKAPAASNLADGQTAPTTPAAAPTSAAAPATTVQPAPAAPTPAAAQVPAAPATTVQPATTTAPPALAVPQGATITSNVETIPEEKISSIRNNLKTILSNINRLLNKKDGFCSAYMQFNNNEENLKKTFKYLDAQEVLTRRIFLPSGQKLKDSIKVIDDFLNALINNENIKNRDDWKKSLEKIQKDLKNESEALNPDGVGPVIITVAPPLELRGEDTRIDVETGAYVSDDDIRAC